MKYNFCTLFDTYYLSRGINLYNSLEEHCDNFHLYVFAFDDNSFDVLIKMNLKNATIIPLNEFEKEDLLAIKQKRTIAEYCWTCTASTISYSIEKYNLDHCTYLDADMMFFSSLEPIFKEIGDSSVAITPHNFSDDLKTEEIYGKYCVQFVYFKNDNDGLQALNWWKQSCIDWCYAILEENRYGDQKYLNFFKEKFSNVIDIENIGAGVAPWNINKFDVTVDLEKIIINDKKDKNKSSPLIFYHYQGLKFTDLEDYIRSQPSEVFIDKVILELIYTLYIQNIISINKKLKGEKYEPKNIIYERAKIKNISRFVKKTVKKSSFLIKLFYFFQTSRYERHKNIG